MQRWRSIGVWLVRGMLATAGAVLLLLVAAALVLETGWGKDRLRALVVSQANNYLTATLEIGALDGSLLRGVELREVRLVRDGRALVGLDRVVVSYSPRELFEGGTLIRRLALEGLRVSATRLVDGRWDLADLVRRDPATLPSQNPSRRLQIDTIIVSRSEVTLGTPVTFGAVHIPTSYRHVEAIAAFASGPEGWRLDVADASFVGTAPDLTVNRVAGGLGAGPEGWHFASLRIATPGSEFSVDGMVARREGPAALALTVAAPHFAFQEWAGVLNGLRNVAVDSGFNLRLTGPLSALETSVDLYSTGGGVRGAFVLDSSVPGWHGRGTAAVQRFDVARWFNRPDRPSDITGDVTFDLDLHLGGTFPTGTFSFTGAHASYIGYEADDVEARGRLTDTEVRLASVTATAYGANVRLAPSTLTIDAPYRFHFVGRADGLDLRQLPRDVPVPHVASTLVMDFDTTGQFTQPFINGTARFGDSIFLDARVEAGATGSIDTREPFTYAGEGRLSEVDLNRFGRDLDVRWLQEPRYAGTLTGRFHVAGSGTDPTTMTVDGGGRLEQAALFDGQLSDGDVTLHIAGGSLEARFDGTLQHVNPALVMADVRYTAALSGRGRGTMRVRDLLAREVTLDDYAMSATMTLRDTEVRGLTIATGEVEAVMEASTLRLTRLVADGPGLSGEASGTLELDGVRSSRLEYRVTHSNLARLVEWLGEGYEGELLSTGVMTGPLDRPRFEGDASIARFVAGGFSAMTTQATYDLTLPDNDPRLAAGTLVARLALAQAFGRALPEASADLDYDEGRLTASLQARLQPGYDLALHGGVTVDPDARTVDVESLVLSALRTEWRLAPTVRPHLAWRDDGFDIEGLELVDAATGQQHLRAGGTWRNGGGGDLRVSGDGLSIDTLLDDRAVPTRYGGTLHLRGALRGSRARPEVQVEFAVTNGRVRRLAYDRFGGRVAWADGTFDLDIRFDQAPGVWLTAVGSVPQTVMDRTQPGGPVRVHLQSSPVSLALVEGVTDIVRNVEGQMQLDVTVLGTSRDPHFSGQVDVSNASFQVVATGARYGNGRLALQLATDRVDVRSLRLEDAQGNPLELTGSLGTHELRMGNLQVALTARQFQVLGNEYGRVDVDARLNFTGEFESPRLQGRIGVTNALINVDRVLDRALFQPYSTREAVLPEIDPIVALNPWDRMGLDIELNVPNTLRLQGDNVQVTPGTPLGLGNIDLRAVGDLYLYKDPAQPLYVTGSFDSVTGAYVFQGRRFELDPASSINFRSDLNPELYVMVNRLISGVETRVSIVGPLRQPELRLSSVPPLEPSDILSLIVFNTSTNELSALQQQQLAVRAGTLAAGFLAAPMMAALERSLGIDTLEIEPGADIRGGPRVTIGNEIAPGLVARFSRQFGPMEYDEATLEYYLSRILRLRATFSDAGSLSARSPFRRVERAGIDLLFFFSF